MLNLVYRRPFGIEQEFFVQLFVEYDPNLRLPTVGDLLRKMFHEQHISFTKVRGRFQQIPYIYIYGYINSRKSKLVKHKPFKEVYNRN